MRRLRRFAIARKWSAVLVLLARCRPPAVVRAVRAIDVPAIKRVSVWAFPHVAEKRREVVAPAFAHRDPASAVLAPVGVLRIGAAILGCAPRAVLVRLRRSGAVFKAGIAGAAKDGPLRAQRQMVRPDAMSRAASDPDCIAVRNFTKVAQPRINVRRLESASVSDEFEGSVSVGRLAGGPQPAIGLHMWSAMTRRLVDLRPKTSFSAGGAVHCGN